MNKQQLVPTLVLHFSHLMQIVQLFQLCHFAKVNRFYFDAGFDLRTVNISYLQQDSVSKHCCLKVQLGLVTANHLHNTNQEVYCC